MPDLRSFGDSKDSEILKISLSVKTPFLRTGALPPSSCSRHRLFDTKVCVANMQPAISGKTMQRHRSVSKHDFTVSDRQVEGAGEKVGEVGGHEDVHGYVAVAGGWNGR